VILPRGRHTLGREVVRARQRARLLRAMTEEVAERGYAATTATAVYRRAGVSSRAFYENFSDVHDCFMAAYDAAVDSLWSSLAKGPGARGSLGALLDTYIEALRDEPAMARTFLVEVYAAGSVALARRREVHELFVRGLESLVASGRPLSPTDRFALDSLVGAITFQMTMRVISGDLGDLARLREDLVDVALRMCPWLQNATS
jgi:AcrR family transcriptional regulator